MRILLLGDTHGRVHAVRDAIDYALEAGCDRIVQVGDFGYGWDLHYPPNGRFPFIVNEFSAQAGLDFYWLDGNHENFDALQEELGDGFTSHEPVKMMSNLYYLPRGSSWDWDGVRFLALGGAYSIDKHVRVEGVSWWRQEMTTRADVERALDRGQADVMLTHDMPAQIFDALAFSTGWYKSDPDSRSNRQMVSGVMEIVKPKLLVHGHFHYRHDTMCGDTRVIGLDRDGTHHLSWTVLDTADWSGVLTRQE